MCQGSVTVAADPGLGSPPGGDRRRSWDREELMSRRVMGLLALVAGLSITSPARAQTPTLDGVQAVGDPVVGKGVAALISGSVDPATVKFKWCHAGEQPGKCAGGGPAGFGPIYVPDAADVGSRLMVAATATIDTFTIEVKSAPTAPVAAPAPTPLAHTGPVGHTDAGTDGRRPAPTPRDALRIRRPRRKRPLRRPSPRPGSIRWAQSSIRRRCWSPDRRQLGSCGRSPSSAYAGTWSRAGPA